MPTADHLVRGNEDSSAGQANERHVLAGRDQHLGAAARGELAVVLPDLLDQLAVRD
jgi:hypothetical protein